MTITTILSSSTYTTPGSKWMLKVSEVPRVHAGTLVDVKGSPSNIHATKKVGDSYFFDMASFTFAYSRQTQPHAAKSYYCMTDALVVDDLNGSWTVVLYEGQTYVVQTTNLEIKSEI